MRHLFAAHLERHSRRNNQIRAITSDIDMSWLAESDKYPVARFLSRRLPTRLDTNPGKLSAPAIRVVPVRQVRSLAWRNWLPSPPRHLTTAAFLCILVINPRSHAPDGVDSQAASAGQAAVRQWIEKLAEILVTPLADPD